MAVAKMRSLAQLSPSSSAVQRTASAPLARRAQAITTTPRFTPILPRVGAISVSHCSSVKRAGSRAAQHTVHITAASASSPGVLSDPSGDAPTEGESDGGQGRLPPATQAICYAAGAGVLCLWWLWSSSYGAAGALFAAATVAAKPGKTPPPPPPPPSPDLSQLLQLSSLRFCGNPMAGLTRATLPGSLPSQMVP